MRPTGRLHIGHWFGALQNWVKLQEQYDCIYCVVDLHAITEWQDTKQLAQQTREMAAVLLACGIDPKKHIVLTRARCPDTRNWPGSSTAWRGSAGSTA